MEFTEDQACGSHPNPESFENSPLSLLWHEIKPNGNSLIYLLVKHKAELRQGRKLADGGWEGSLHEANPEHEKKNPTAQSSHLRAWFTNRTCTCAHTETTCIWQRKSQSPFPHLLLGLWWLNPALCTENALRISFHFISLSCGLSAAQEEKPVVCDRIFWFTHCMLGTPMGNHLFW